jgi:hypothetical protein
MRAMNRTFGTGSSLVLVAWWAIRSWKLSSWWVVENSVRWAAPAMSVAAARERKASALD